MKYNFEKEKIIESLKSRNFANKLINYKEFLELYAEYKSGISELEFAKILGIKEANFKNIKYGSEKTRILRTDKKEISESRKKEIQEELKSRGYENRTINYGEFLNLYEEYKLEMNEPEFAEILGIKYAHWNKMKNHKTKAKILKVKTTELSEENKKRNEEIKEEIRALGYEDKYIDYEEFLQLYEKYKSEVTEKNFLEILGITQNNFNNIKYGRQKTKVLEKKQERISEKTKNEIRSEIASKGYENRSINYEEFLKIYEKYKGKIKEQRFAEILGIKYCSWNRLKNQSPKAKTVILRKADKEKLEAKEQDLKRKNVEKRFLEAKNYDIKTFEKISQKYDITIKEIIQILFNNNQYLCEIMENKLYEKGKIFIGNREIDKEFLKKYGEQLTKKAHNYSKIIGKKLHTSRYSEDIAQEILISMMETTGYILLNFEETDAVKILKKLLIDNIQNKHLALKRIKLRDAEKNVTRYSRSTQLEEKDINEIIMQIQEDSTPIDVMKICILNGMDKKQAIKFCMKRCRINQKRLLDMMKAYLQQNNTIKRTEEGKLYLER